jgi:uracil phosphoribosyltransferase
MRRLTPYADNHPHIQSMLAKLANGATQTADYRLAFAQLGEELGKTIAEHLAKDRSVTLVASSEDADWLMQGLLNGMKRPSTSIAVLWNTRSNALQGKSLPPNSPFQRADFDVAPVVKSFIESTATSDTLIVCKSIIYTSCVVRTNLLHMITQVDPRRIVIAAPVMFHDAEAKLRREFPDEISSKFEFYYFAVDDEQNERGEVIPGIGGTVYERLGIGNAQTKNQYIPQIVRARRELLRASR